MTKLKLGPLIEDKPVKVAVELPGPLHRDLAAYAEVLARETGQPAAGMVTGFSRLSTKPGPQIAIAMAARMVSPTSHRNMRRIARIMPFPLSCRWQDRVSAAGMRP